MQNKHTSGSISYSKSKRLTCLNYMMALVLLALLSSFSDVQAASKKPAGVKTQTKNKANQQLSLTLNQAIKHYEASEFGQAIPLFLKLIAIEEKNPNITGADLAYSYNLLADCYKHEKQLDKAEHYYLKAIATDEAELVLEHPNLMIHYGDLGVLYQDQNRLGEAEDCYLKSIKERFHTGGDERTNINLSYLGNTYERLGDIYATKSEPRKAKENYELAITHKTSSVTQQDGGLDNIDAERLHRKVAEIDFYEKRYDDAGRVYEHILMPLQTEIWGAEAPQVIFSEGMLAQVYRQQGAYDKAETLTLKIIAVIEKNAGSEHIFLANNYTKLALIYRLQKQYPKAESYLLKAIAIGEKSPTAKGVNLADWNHLLAQIYHDQEMLDKAEPLYLKVIAMHESKQEFEHQDLIGAYNGLGIMYLQYGMFDKAEPLFKKAVDMTIKNYGVADKDSQVLIKNYLFSLESQYKDTKELRMGWGLPPAEVKPN